MIHCPACKSLNLIPLFNMGNQPMSLVALQHTPSASKALERYPIRLVICNNCSHVHNIDYNDNYVSYSAAGCRMYNDGSGWQEHVQMVRELAEMQTLDLIVEIGAGDCEFLDSLEVGAIKLAVDPCKSVERARELGIQYDRDYFDPETHMPVGAQDMLIIMRHLLEHMEEPRDFIEAIVERARHRSIAHLTHLLIEVPCCENALEKCRIEDWTYEHPQHFTAESLTQLLDRAGVGTHLVNYSYNGEVLVAFGTILPTKPMSETVYQYADEFRKAELNIVRTGDWIRQHLDEIAFWGGAGKSAMFLRKFGVPDNALVVDCHTEKWDYCVPGTGIKIKPPSALLGHDKRPIIIVTTSWRANDIRNKIVKHKIPCESLYKFEGGELVEVPLGN